MSNHARESTFLSTTETVTYDPSNDLQRPPSVSDAHDNTRKMTDPPTFMPGYGDRPLPIRKEATINPLNIPPIIPPEHSRRTLVLCFDGTGDEFDNDNSNIVQFVSLLKKDDRSKQMVYYQTGIGTYTTPNIVTPLLSKISKVLDQAVALHLDKHVMDGYEFLMQNYMAGDRICIFGFSRGAYTARSLAGMLHKVGLLPADNWQQVPFAYKMYTRTDKVGWEQSNAFKKAFSIDVPIEFLGVWDTVDSVGLIPKRLPFTTSNTIVHTFRHAVSLDERRAKFKANLWNRPNEEEAKLGIHSGDAKQTATETPRSSMSSTKKASKRKETGHSREDPSFHWFNEDEADLDCRERQWSARRESMRSTDVEEVWFAGCHSDVGGGSVKNSTRHSLARIPLRWMIRECFKTNSGIMFDSRRLWDVGLDPSTLYPYVTPRPARLPGGGSRLQAVPKETKRPWVKRLFSEFPPCSARQDATSALKDGKSGRRITEEEEELRDATAPMYDQLKLKPVWWLLELLPMEFRYQRGDAKWVSWFGMNLARPRFIPKQKTRGFKVHRSVQSRMEASQDKRYIPRALFSVNPTWVD
ncbi:hypothetical protein AAF712_009758 [Marasmius tenuissimus]|uniref:T6SS Phospholipase effector Tle1-like catalytic domain-containing protein n=1 Tax=Marasmius tenuissimus TaxID=585030 RepID=A0ABR2ZRL8_9AGAR